MSRLSNNGHLSSALDVLGASLKGELYRQRRSKYVLVVEVPLPWGVLALKASQRYRDATKLAVNCDVRWEDQLALFKSLTGLSCKPGDLVAYRTRLHQLCSHACRKMGVRSIFPDGFSFDIDTGNRRARLSEVVRRCVEEGVAPYLREHSADELFGSIPGAFDGLAYIGETRLQILRFCAMAVLGRLTDARSVYDLIRLGNPSGDSNLSEERGGMLVEDDWRAFVENAGRLFER